MKIKRNGLKSCKKLSRILSDTAGVPVMASDRKYNTELVNEKVGYIFKTQEAEKYTVAETVKILKKQIQG